MYLEQDKQCVVIHVEPVCLTLPFLSDSDVDNDAKKNKYVFHFFILDLANNALKIKCWWFYIYFLPKNCLNCSY